MSRLRRIEIQHIRCLESVIVEPGPGINLISGKNASGKTSFLEALAILSSGRSFRSHRLTSVCSRGEQGFIISGRVKNNSESHQVGIQMEQGKTQLRADGQKLKKTSELAGLLPVAVIHQQSHEILTQGPKMRRQFLDWGVFHVEHHYLSLWRRYQRALKQRNSALQNNVNTARAWDHELVDTAVQINALRKRYFSDMLPYFYDYTDQIVAQKLALDIEYYAGWPEEADLSKLLQEGFDRDCVAGYTRIGPHRADLRIRTDGIAVQEVVSRGQQKLLVCALMLAVAKTFQLRSGKHCVLLIDDLDAELDDRHVQTMMTLIAALRTQVFITTTDWQRLAAATDCEKKVFHVEHGYFKEVI